MNVGTRLQKTGMLDHLKTLDDVVEDYLKRFDFSSAAANHSKGHDDPVVDFCREADCLATAVKRAVDGRRRDGKLFSKGSCVRTSSKQEMAEALLKRLPEVRKCRDFEQLFEVVDACSPWGIGPMSRYAVAERIGAYIKIKPKAFLYLHAGPAKGWKALTGRAAPSRVAVEALPKALRRIELYHVENLLCEYRDTLRPRMWSV
jgi:hypothetical protein